MSLEVKEPLFNYDSLAQADKQFVFSCAREIKNLYKQSQESIVQIGRLLIEAKHLLKAQLGHGYFGLWLASEFRWSADKAERFMNVARMSDSFPQIAENENNIDTSALYLLSKPSTPEIARLEAIARVEAGERVTHNAAKEIIRETSLPAPIITPAPMSPSSVTPTPTSPQHTLCPIVEVIETSPKKANHQLINSSVSVEWYTPKPIIDASRELLGEIDLDPASNAFANETVKAKTFYTKGDDGLQHHWNGKVFLNPPYNRGEDGESNQAKWSRYLIEQYHLGNVVEAILLVNASTGAKWFQSLWDFPICFVKGRIEFYNSEGNSDSPTHYSSIIYFGSQIKRFTQIFSKFGHIAPSINNPEQKDMVVTSFIKNYT